MSCITCTHGIYVFCVYANAYAHSNDVWECQVATVVLSRRDMPLCPDAVVHVCREQLMPVCHCNESCSHIILKTAIISSYVTHKPVEYIRTSSLTLRFSVGSSSDLCRIFINAPYCCMKIGQTGKINTPKSDEGRC